MVPNEESGSEVYLETGASMDRKTLVNSLTLTVASRSYDEVVPWRSRGSNVWVLQMLQELKFCPVEDVIVFETAAAEQVAEQPA